MAEITIEFEFRNQRFKDASKGLLAFGRDMQMSWNSIPGVLRKQLKDYLDTVAEALAKRHGNPWPAGTSNASLSRRSGALIEAIRKSVYVAGGSIDEVYGSIGAPLVYARIQEQGGTIRAKHAKYLTIPLPAALNPDGTPKKRKARDWSDTIIIKSKHGNLLIVQKKGRDLIPLYVLKRSVKIPPRLNLETTLKAGLPYFVDHAMEAMMNAMRWENG